MIERKKEKYLPRTIDKRKKFEEKIIGVFLQNLCKLNIIFPDELSLLVPTKTRQTFLLSQNLS